MNGRYFNHVKGIFSKLDIDEHIPRRWRLTQFYYDEGHRPDSYPVFLKPEWGQNSKGIMLVRNEEEYQAFQRIAGKAKVPFIVQEAAKATIEYELYYLRSPVNEDDCGFLSITQVNNSSGESHPINSIHNSSTRYFDITESFSDSEKEKVWEYLCSIGRFRMARVGLKADSREALLRGNFRIVEINVFLPMPLVLLADDVEREEKIKIIDKTMSLSAQLVRQIPREEKGRWIFFRKMKAQYRISS